MKILYLFFFFLILYLLGAAYLYFTQDEKVFNRKFAKKISPAVAKHIYFTTSDGVRLEGGYVENKKVAPLVLYFSGNSNNVLEFLDNIAPKIKDYNFIGFNYPGYAGSEGKPCEKCIEKYALEIFDKYHPDYLMGRSLGSAVASFVGANKKIKGILLITPIDSILNIAKSRYPFFPISILLKHKFEAYKNLMKIDAPVSLLLVKNDETVPKKSISTVINSIRNLRDVEVIEGVGHGNIYEYKGIEKIIEKLLKRVSNTTT
jgi:surfactin synthase thioesterase subunit